MCQLWALHIVTKRQFFYIYTLGIDHYVLVWHWCKHVADYAEPTCGLLTVGRLFHVNFLAGLQS